MYEVGTKWRPQSVVNGKLILCSMGRLVIARGIPVLGLGVQMTRQPKAYLEVPAKRGCSVCAILQHSILVPVAMFSITISVMSSLGMFTVYQRMIYLVPYRSSHIKPLLNEPRQLVRLRVHTTIQRPYKRRLVRD
jgi:hypothetical protein